MVIVRIRHGAGIPAGRVGSINNGIDINARRVRNNSLRKLGAERANGRDAHTNLVGAQLPFPFFFLHSSLLLFLLPLFPHLLPTTAKESVKARLSSLAGPGEARPPSDI